MGDFAPMSLAGDEFMTDQPLARMLRYELPHWLRARLSSRQIVLEFGTAKLVCGPCSSLSNITLYIISCDSFEPSRRHGSR